MAAKFSVPVQTSPGAHPASCTMGTRSFPGVKSGRGVTLTPHPLLLSWTRKGRAIPLLPLWAVRPVQSLSACTRVNFTFTSVVQADSRNLQVSCSHAIRVCKVMEQSSSAETDGCSAGQEFSLPNIVLSPTHVGASHCCLIFKLSD